MQKEEDRQSTNLREYLARLYKGFDRTGSIVAAEKKEDLSGKDVREVLFSGQSSLEEIRGALIYLFLIKEDQSLRTLSRILQTGYLEEVKDFIVELLATRGTSGHVDAIIRLIRRGSILDRKRLLGALLKLASTDDERIRKLLNRYLRYGDQHSRLLAIRAVARPGASAFVEELLYLLEKEAAEPVRLAVVDALGTLGDARVIPGLRWASEDDPNASVRARAAEMLRAAERSDL